jgi:hypothetical protein
MMGFMKTVKEDRLVSQQQVITSDVSFLHCGTVTGAYQHPSFTLGAPNVLMTF